MDEKKMNPSGSRSGSETLVMTVKESLPAMDTKHDFHVCLVMFRITYTCPVGYVIEEPNRNDEQPEFVPLLQETFDVMCGDDANWLPLPPGGGTAMPSCIRKKDSKL